MGDIDMLLQQGVIAMDMPALTWAERTALNMLEQAASHGNPCPTNIDLEIATGFNSTSMGPKLIRALEIKGLIVVRRFQKFREVQIVATGDWTARNRSMHVERPHVPRGMRSRSPIPTDRKPYKSRGR